MVIVKETKDKTKQKYLYYAKVLRNFDILFLRYFSLENMFLHFRLDNKINLKYKCAAKKYRSG